MSDFYFEPAASQQEAEAALRGLALDKAAAQPAFVACAESAVAPPQMLFANSAMLSLFSSADLNTLGRRLFLASDPGAKRLASLIQKASSSAAPRLERLRFYFGLTTQMFTFACHWVARPGRAPLFAATVLDAPAQLLNERPAAKRPETTTDVSEPAALPRETKAVRFLWRTDAEDRFTEITPPLASVVGEASADLVGQTIRDVSERLHLDPSGALAQAFAKRETWSGVEVLWPIAGTATIVPVGLGALPTFDRGRHFEGYHGFGVICVTRVAPAPAGHLAAALDLDHAAAEAVKVEEAGFWTPSYDTENVVFLRPLATKLVSPDSSADKIESIGVEPDESAESEPVPTPDLSAAEQHAFHEIARALANEEIASEEPAAREETIAAAESVADTTPLMAPEAAETQAAIETPEDQVLLAPEAEVEVVEAAAPEPPSEAEQLTRNAAAIFAHLNAGLLVSRNEEPIFANRFLLDLLGYEDLEAFQKGGGLPRLLAQPAAQGSTTVELTTREGALVPMIAREQCAEWDHLPATLLILQPTQKSEAHSTIDAKLTHYETESRELNAILDTATDGVAVLDAAGRIMTLNRSGEALFGYDQNEVIDEPFSLLFDAESRAIAEDYLEGLKTNGVKSLLNDGREVVGRARQGGLIPIFMTLGRVSSSHAEDKDLKFCALLRDMTHWKKVEQELDEARKEAERASTAKSDFLAKVSHEIRTPLNAILGFAEIIMDERFGPIGNERYKDYLKDIHMSGAHVMSLVNDLLDLSKIEAGKLELDFHDVDANRIISECVTLMQPQANRERVIMRMSLASNFPPISADERSLRQIILNLLSNAVKFNEPGGQVIVATAWNDTGHAVIRIRDTGIGMSETDIETALEPFRQLATTRQTTGTGLGLPLTKALVEANHAYFSIKSKKQEGTLVEVTFPVMRVSA
ncbi:ATP-binding protein [Methyloferula stellata]|uniref:ATP-binding protein n=1 Tax=Methyloferula stellata TaxID=876270 RepID=UPI0003695D8C|nr:ATP-binding protein [Methyloferula stellata]